MHIEMFNLIQNGRPLQGLRPSAPNAHGFAPVATGGTSLQDVNTLEKLHNKAVIETCCGKEPFDLKNGSQNFPSLTWNRYEIRLNRPIRTANGNSEECCAALGR